MYKLFKYIEEVENRSIPEEIEWEYNIYLYYKDKSLIEDKIISEILDKAYEWLYNNLNNLEKYNIEGETRFYDYLYYKEKDGKRKFLIAYNKANKQNDIDRNNLLYPLSDYMGNYYFKYFEKYNHSKFFNKDISIFIIRGYLNYALDMGNYKINFFRYI